MSPQWLGESWMDEVADLDAFVSHLDDQLLPALVRSHRLGELDWSGRVRVSVGEGDEVGQAARGVGEEREDGVGVGRGEREGGGWLERGTGRLLGGGKFLSSGSATISRCVMMVIFPKGPTRRGS